MILSSLDTALLAVFLLLLMFGMGATLDAESFRAVLRRPRMLAIGLVLMAPELYGVTVVPLSAAAAVLYRARSEA